MTQTNDERPSPPMTADKQAMIRSQAGMRYIAQMTIYNNGDFARLEQFVRESYAPAALEESSGEERLTAFRQGYAVDGRLRIVQVVGADPHHIVAVIECERSGAYFLEDMTVEPDYPHRILTYDHIALEVEEDAPETDAET